MFLAKNLPQKTNDCTQIISVYPWQIHVCLLAFPNHVPDSFRLSRHLHTFADCPYNCRLFQEIADIFVLVCSVRYSSGKRVAPRPWLAFLEKPWYKWHTSFLALHITYNANHPIKNTRISVRPSSFLRPSGSLYPPEFWNWVERRVEVQALSPEIAKKKKKKKKKNFSV